MTRKPTRPKHKLPWWATAVQWFALLCLTASAIVNAQTDQGILMAINCICIGFIFFGLLLGRFIDQKIANIDAVFADLKMAEAMTIDLARQCQKALDEGTIEVVMINPDHQLSVTKH